MATLYGAGLRVSESTLIAARFASSTGRATKARTVGIHPSAIAYIAEWLDVRADLGIRRWDPLFCCTAIDCRGNIVKTAYVRQLLKRLAAKAGVEKRVHPHGLRHTFAVELRREGADLLIIQKSLGHSSAAVTYGYINHLDPGEVVEWSRPSWTSSTPVGRSS